MKALHIRFEGLTASYPYPFLRSGTMLSMPLPPYSSIFGMISACAGRDITPHGWMLGYEFTSNERLSTELERTVRLKTDKAGRLRLNPEQGLARRQFHYHPKLDVYLTDLSLKSVFFEPVTPPRFGRSQDLAWICFARDIDLESVEAAGVRGTLAPYPDSPIGQIMPPLVDYYRNEQAGYTRVPGRISRYVAIPGGGFSFELHATPRLRLFHPDDSSQPKHGIILNDFQA